MPAIAEKHECMNGVVFRYAHTTDGWYYREWNKATRKYRISKITDAITKEDAITNAYKVLVTFNTTEPVKKPRQVSHQPKEINIEEEIRLFLIWEEKRVMAGLKDDGAHERRKSSMRVLMRYLQLKEIEYPSQLHQNVFDDYIVWRVGKEKNTIKTEFKDIGCFLRQWLNRNGKISNELASSPFLIPRITINEDDLDANPSISQNDYNIINECIRGEWRETAQHKGGHYMRRYFHTFIHLLWNSGMRPSELLATRFKDVTITNPKRWSESEQQWVDDYKMSIFVRKSKTGRKRNVLLTSNSAYNFIEFKQYIDKWLKMNLPSFTLNEEHLIFGKPDNQMEKTFTYRYLSNNWTDVLSLVGGKLEGNKFSDRSYTIYSLRTSFITKCIEKGIDVYLTAELVGNSVTIIQRFYHKYDVMKNAEQIQAIKRGRKKGKPDVVELDVMNL